MTHYDDGKETFRCEHGKVRGIEDEARRCKVCDPITPATLTSAEPPQELFLCPNCDQGHNEMAHEPPCPLARVSAPTSSSSDGIGALVAKYRKRASEWGKHHALRVPQFFIEQELDAVADDLEALAASLTEERTRLETEAFQIRTLAAEYGWTYTRSLWEWLRRQFGSITDARKRAEAAEAARDEALGRLTRERDVALASRHSLEDQLIDAEASRETFRQAAELNRQAVDASSAREAALRVALTRLEFCGPIYGSQTCPACKWNRENGHDTAGCWLAAALAVSSSRCPHCDGPHDGSCVANLPTGDALAVSPLPPQEDR